MDPKVVSKKPVRKTKVKPTRDAIVAERSVLKANLGKRKVAPIIDTEPEEECVRSPSFLSLHGACSSINVQSDPQRRPNLVVPQVLFLSSARRPNFSVPTHLSRINQPSPSPVLMPIQSSGAMAPFAVWPAMRRRSPISTTSSTAVMGRTKMRAQRGWLHSVPPLRLSKLRAKKRYVI